MLPAGMGDRGPGVAACGALLIPLPRTVPDRYAPRFQAVAKRLHAEFWEMRAAPGLLLDA